MVDLVTAGKLKLSFGSNSVAILHCRMLKLIMG